MSAKSTHIPTQYLWCQLLHWQWVAYEDIRILQKSHHTIPLKGVCHKIFDLQFLSWFEPIWAPEKQAEWSIFRFCFDFVEIFDHKVASAVWNTPQDDLRILQHTIEIISTVCNTPRRWSLYTPQRRSQLCATHRGDDLGGAQHTAEIISEVCNTPQRWSWQCAVYCRDDLRGVQPTEEMISAVCNPLRRWSPRCATHRGDDLRSVQHTSEINCTLQNQNQNLHFSIIAFKETIRRNPFMGKHIYHERKDLKICTLWRQLCDQISWWNWNQIQKYISLFIRAKWVQIMKKLEVKNLMTHSP